jgi:hypothetical protein
MTLMESPDYRDVPSSSAFHLAKTTSLYIMSLSNTQVFPPWNFDRWRAVDDRVRGGSSISHFDSVEVDVETENAEVDLSTEKVSKGKAARFWGNLGELLGSHYLYAGTDGPRYLDTRRSRLRFPNPPLWSCST